MFEGAHAPPFYNDLYNFVDGAQSDIFRDSYISIPDPSPVAALPVLNQTATAGVNLPFDSPNSNTTSSGSNTISFADSWCVHPESFNPIFLLI